MSTTAALKIQGELARIMPNIGGAKYEKTEVSPSIALYAAPMCARELPNYEGH